MKRLHIFMIVTIFIYNTAYSQVFVNEILTPNITNNEESFGQHITMIVTMRNDEKRSYKGVMFRNDNEEIISGVVEQTDRKDCQRINFWLKNGKVSDMQNAIIYKPFFNGYPLNDDSFILKGDSGTILIMRGEKYYYFYDKRVYKTLLKENENKEILSKCMELIPFLIINSTLKLKTEKIKNIEMSKLGNIDCKKVNLESINNKIVTCWISNEGLILMTESETGEIVMMPNWYKVDNKYYPRRILMKNIAEYRTIEINYSERLSINNNDFSKYASLSSLDKY
jgi:hypothetical protein